MGKAPLHDEYEHMGNSSLYDYIISFINIDIKVPKSISKDDVTNTEWDYIKHRIPSAREYYF